MLHLSYAELPKTVPKFIQVLFSRFIERLNRIIETVMAEE